MLLALWIDRWDVNVWLATTWDSGDTSSNIALSGGNLIATHN